MSSMHLHNINTSCNSRDCNDHWDVVKKKIIDIYGEIVFRSWFKSVSLSSYDSGTIFLIAPSRFIRDWIRTNYLDFIFRAWKELDKKVLSVDLIVLDDNAKSRLNKKNESNFLKIEVDGKNERKNYNDLILEIDSQINVEEDRLKQFDLFGLENVNISVKDNVDNVSNSIQSTNKVKEESIKLKKGFRSKFLEDSNLYVGDGLDFIIKPQEKYALTQEELDDRDLVFDKKYTFDTFVQGESNELAYFASKKIAENKKISGMNHNPLFLYGGVGVGKTHLMHAIANYRIQEFKEKYKDNWLKKAQEKIIYLPSEKFMNEFLNALKSKNVKNFKDKFRGVDILMIDDVQFFMGKGYTQEEFFHTLNNLMNDGKQLIISADRLPGMLTGLDEKIRSRLGWGLVADIRSGGYDLRLGILKCKSRYLGVEFEDHILKYLAENIDNNIRELEGALNKLVVMKQLSPNITITIDLINDKLSDMMKNCANGNLVAVNNSNKNKITANSYIKENDKKNNVVKNDAVITSNYKLQRGNQITPVFIQEVVANYFQISVKDILSDIRVRHLAMPRQIAMYLTKKLTSLSLMEIARYFGGKNHSTIIHGIYKISANIKNDIDLSSDVDNIIKSLRSN